MMAAIRGWWQRRRGDALLRQAIRKDLWAIGPERAVSTPNVHRVALGPQDVIIVCCGREVTSEMIQNIQSRFRGIFPQHPILVIDPTIKIEIIERGQVEAVAARLSA